MAERRKTPDILTDLLGANASANAGRETSQQASKTSKRQAGKTAYLDVKAAATTAAIENALPEVSGDETLTEGKVKVTFYLSKGAVDALDDAHLSLRRMARSNRRGGVSKSLIVEESLKAAAEELRHSGLSSHLADKVL